MFSLTIVFGPVPCSLLYSDEEHFKAAIAACSASAKTTSFEGDDLKLEDDFGQGVCIKRASIHGFSYEDMNKTKIARIERGLHDMRVQIEANDRGRTDPKISNAMRAAAGPGVLSPAFNGAFRHQ